MKGTPHLQVQTKLCKKEHVNSRTRVNFCLHRSKCSQTFINICLEQQVRYSWKVCVECVKLERYMYVVFHLAANTAVVIHVNVSSSH